MEKRKQFKNKEQKQKKMMSSKHMNLTSNDSSPKMLPIPNHVKKQK